MRFGRALLVAALAMTFSSVRAGPAEDAQGLLRRDSDQFLWYTWQEHDFGHNHFWISLTDHREGFPVARSPGINAELRATVTWLDAATGEIRERRFSSFAREGYEVFTEGPLYSGASGQILVALPHDFGDVSAIVDFWAAFPDIPVECPPAGEPGPCGGAVETFFNDLLFPRYDAMPLPAELN